MLQLYDPDRSQVVLNRGRISSWIAFQGSAHAASAHAADLDKGAGFRILTGTVISPTLGSQIRDFLQQLPGRKVAPVGACRPA